jgi:hypothetical protein
MPDEDIGEHDLCLLWDEDMMDIFRCGGVAIG